MSRPATVKSPPEWWASRANLALLAQHLTDELRADEIAYAIEKPWKYESEYRDAERALEEEEEMTP